MSPDGLNKATEPIDNKMTPEEIQKHTNIINKMSRLDMARMWRHTPVGHIYFDTTLPFYEIFKIRFNELGGFSPEISKEIGW